MSTQKITLIVGDLNDDDTIDVKTVACTLINYSEVHVDPYYSHGDDHYEVLLPQGASFLEVHTKLQENKGERCTVQIGIDSLARLGQPFFILFS